jgi:hypothetical protein
MVGRCGKNSEDSNSEADQCHQKHGDECVTGEVETQGSKVPPVYLNLKCGETGLSSAEIECVPLNG